ncbi:MULTISPECIES: IMPACT family protein [Flectobacillus]|uniref:YigZ family protein n=1 Tax=Flectobacillus roseus TaxID=502259 RepID=A0ABT6YAI0_9BACT|nr:MULTISPECIES: YigZ family protein [Flectobacillus]MDI9860588.1 YigZ family protein [Flectobacillus roseus]MDI9872440.1 YigZ family protein [Flectobacillus roseus]NBA78116.1 YigZ family protein [Emticicia sp. ODNR4P]PAC27478.1 YigZ family protein [Flectobacillus sp. BAB-3569]
MLFEDTYKTITGSAEGLFKDKGSKFFAYAYPIEDESEVKDLVDQLKKEHFKAVHHCYAYRLGQDRTNFRVNDDGEPSGSAGKPILNVLLSKDITNILVVVVRYFGGTLLGVPGLINAYKTATQEALAEAEIIEKTVNEIYEVRFEFVQMNDVMKVVKEFGLKVKNQLFDNQCTLQLEFRRNMTNQIIGKLEKIEPIEIEHIATV